MTDEHSTIDDPRAFWDDRYSESDRIWSGRVNAALADVTLGLTSGRALDLGCGEGGDSIWLAEHGWSVTGVDISEVALERAAAAASERDVSDRMTWVGADLAAWSPEDGYDLVTACFFQSPITLPRHDILRRVAAAIRPGGHLLVVGHASAPSWSPATLDEGHHGSARLTAAEEVAALALPDSDWTIEIVEDRPRDITGPEGQSGSILDAVVLARRAG